MLHDLFLLSEYFNPPFLFMTEEELIKRYGPQAFFTALSLGFLERHTVPCAFGAKDSVCALTSKGVEIVLNKPMSAINAA